MKTFKKSLTILILIISILFINGCTIIKGGDGDDKEIINTIAENGVMTANFSVISYNQLNVPTAIGSGVAYFKESYTDFSYYYVLTNNHVVHNLANFEVRDAYGEKYRAAVIAKDSTYDLAVLKFMSEKTYFVPNLLQSNVNENEKIICLGEPNGIQNTVTLGRVVEYTKVDVDGGSLSLDNGGSQVEFEVIKHDAPINGGSSGGVVLDYNFNIVAINFAASRDKETGKFLASYAVQSTKVIEFLLSKDLA